MPTVYLPTEHSGAELALAGRVAQELECSALYVTWSPRGYEGPDCEAVPVATPAVPAATPAPGAGGLSLLSRLGACLAAIFRLPDDVERERRADG